jgi:hypothetical protein
LLIIKEKAHYLHERGNIPVTKQPKNGIFVGFFQMQRYSNFLKKQKNNYHIGRQAV